MQYQRIIKGFHRKYCGICIRILVFLLTFSLIFTSLFLSSFVVLAETEQQEENIKITGVQMPNLAANPGFEDDLANWKLTIKTATIEVDNTVFYEGSKSLKVTAQSGQRGVIDQEYIAVDPNSIYLLSGYIKTENWTPDTAEATLELYYYDSNKTYITGTYMKVVAPTGTNDWQKFEVPVLSQAPGASYVRLRLNANKGVGTVWFDNISFTKIVNPQDLAYITVTAEKTQLETGDTTVLNISGVLGDGSVADLSQAEIVYISDAPHVATVENGVVTAVGAGQANINVRVTLNGKTEQASISFTVVGKVLTVIYNFKDGIGSTIENNGWKVEECTSSYRNQPYGIQVQSNKIGDYIKFAIKVPEDGYYTVKFTGAGASGGAISELFIDNMYVGQIDFYSAVYIPAQDPLFLKTLWLSNGIHYFTIKAVGKSLSWGYNMYPGEMALIRKESLPVLETVEATVSKTELAVGETAVITAVGVMSDGYRDLLRDEDAVVEYVSSDISIAQVDGKGIITAKSSGNADITVKVTMNGVTKEKVFQITVNDKVLETVEFTLEKNEIPAGLTTTSQIKAKLNDGSDVNLKDTKIVYRSSNEAVATVNENGVVTAVAEGTAVIYADVTLGNTTVTGEAQIYVVPVRLEIIMVTINKTSLFVGRQAVVTVTGKMNNGAEAHMANAEVVFSSEDESILSVEEKNEDNGAITARYGIVTAKKPGSAKVTVNVTLDGVTKSGDTDTIKVESTEGITNTKTRSTYYTPEKIEAARENIQLYDWARSIRDGVVEEANKYVDKAEILWNMVPPQSIPRSITVNPQYTCPACGADLRAKYGNYPWIMDPINDPWKVKCPNCGIRFPSNDFEAYYKSGLNENGIFDPNKADPNYLKNTLYPEKGEDWGVDNGYGWIAPNGVKQTFIAYYAHWGIWYSTGIIQRALDALRDAYIYTGDIKYARTGTILLDRIADVYPDMNLAVYKDADGYRNSHGGTGEGKVVGCIWETGLTQSFLKAYDAFFPAMDDPELINFLMKKSAQYDLDNPKNTGALIRKNIEDGIVRQIYPAVKSAKIRGNFGMHQASLALAAVVLDSNPETKEWLDFTFQAGEFLSGPYRITGGDIMATLVNKVDRDGHGNEAAPGYNILWLSQLKEVADVLDGYDGYPGADLYQNPKFMKMFSGMYPLILCERYTAQIGDSGGTGNTGLVVSISDAVEGFMKFGDPVLAQLAYFLNNNSVTGLHGGIFTKNPEAVAQEIQKVIDEKGKLELGSDNLTGYGFAVLRDGKNNKQFFGYQIPFATLSAFDNTAGFKFFENSGTIQFEADAPGHRISFKFNVPKTDIYEVDINPFKATSYGIYDIKIDGEKVATVDFYGGSGASSNLEVVANMELTEGEHIITFEGTGKNENASGYKMGVIHIILFDEEALRIKNDSSLIDTQRDFWMYYGRTNTSHAHRDQLNLGVHAYGLDISPDLGYPEETGEQPHRTEWVSNTVSHNTVVVDGTKQKDYYGGFPLHFDSTDMVKIMDVDSSGAYDQTEMYRRTVVMVKVNEEISYGVDFFRVEGGKDHYYSFHGAEATVTAEGLNLVPQADANGQYVGTYAGRDVEFGVRPANDSAPGWGYKGSGFHWLKNVDKDENPGNIFSIDWDIIDTRKVLPQPMDIHLRLTMLGEYDDVAIMDGQPPKKPGNPAWLKYMIAHRSGENLKSTFTAVIEPYKDSRYIESISEVPVTVNGEAAVGDVKAVKVVLKDGRTDYIVSSLDKDTVYTVDGKFQFKGFLGVYSEKGGKQVYAYVNEGTIIGDIVSELPAVVEGTVKNFTKELSINNELVVQITNDVNIDKIVNELTGKFIYIKNDGLQNAAYKINGIKTVNGNEVTIDLGATTLIRSYIDSKDMSQGFNYNIAEDNTFVIPMSFEDNKSDVSLEYIKVGNNLVPGFEPKKLKYKVVLPYGVTAIPPVTAKAARAGSTVEVIQASQIPGKALINVTAEDGMTVQTYEVEFVYETRDDMFTVDNVKFTDLNGNEITGLIGGTDIKASVEITNNTEMAMPAVIIIALFDKNDRVVNYAMASQLIGANTIVTLEAGFRLPQDVKENKVKAFIWDSWEGMRPLSNVVTFPSN